MTLVYRKDQSSVDLDVYPTDLHIKQEVNEEEETVAYSPGYSNVKEEVFSETEDDFYPDFECTACNLKFQSQPQLVSHIKTHEKILHCSYCTYSTKRRSHFNDHLRSHTGYKPYQCNYCDYRSGLKGNLKRHVVRIHNRLNDTSTPKQFQCANCNYACPNKTLLVRHVKMHVNKVETYNLRSKTDVKPNLAAIKFEDQPKPLLKCEECAYTCVRKTHLNDHIKIHSGEKPFVCVLCNYRTGHKSHLTRHMKVHVKKEETAVLNMLPVPAQQPVCVSKQVYRCLVCGYKSQIKHCFAKHMRLHLGVALFTCNLCNFSAKCSADIKQHIKIHDGYREFCCDACDYKSKSKGRLRRHIALHR